MKENQDFSIRILELPNIWPYFENGRSSKSDTPENKPPVAGEHSLASFEALLATIPPDQIELNTEKAFKKFGTRKLNPTLAQIILAQKNRKKKDHILRKPLTLKASITVLSITIRDYSKDEVTIQLMTSVGADMEELLDFMVAECMIKKEERGSMKVRWLESDTLASATPRDKRFIDKCMETNYEREGTREDIDIYYNVTDESTLWRNNIAYVTFRMPFNLRLFPFDTLNINLILETKEPYDINQVIIIRDTSDDDESGIHSPFRELSEADIPRDFIIINRAKVNTEEPKVFADSYGKSYELGAGLIYHFGLKRKSNTFIWRTFVPGIMIILISTIPTTITLLSRENSSARIETLILLIPGSLVASAALQIAAAQGTPPFSGRTLTDTLFISSYIHLILLLLSLFVIGFWISKVLLVVALGLLVTTLSYYIIMIIKNLKEEKRTSETAVESFD